MGEDTLWDGSSLAIVFPVDTTEQVRCTSISITDDTVLEGEHDFSIAITSAGTSPYASIDPNASVTTVTIVDDEGENKARLHTFLRSMEYYSIDLRNVWSLAFNEYYCDFTIALKEVDRYAKTVSYFR